MRNVSAVRGDAEVIVALDVREVVGGIALVVAITPVRVVASGIATAVLDDDNYRQVRSKIGV